MTGDDGPTDDEGSSVADADRGPAGGVEVADGRTEGRRALAQGTFDLLHPGHVHYLQEAAARGDELHAVVARSSNVDHKEPPILSAAQRREMVAAVEPVDEAHCGHPEDIFVPVERIDPDVIVLGHDQHHDEDAIAAALAERGIDCAVERASPRPDGDDLLVSTRTIVERILDRRG
ncbi:FAD synthase [Halobacteriales archaeon SW_7_68_16]|nr:MAG: FAD synthase [Halobacteriales archaeon SW_7_68_16]